MSKVESKLVGHLVTMSRQTRIPLLLTDKPCDAWAQSIAEGVEGSYYADYYSIRECASTFGLRVLSGHRGGLFIDQAVLDEVRVVRPEWIARRFQFEELKEEGKKEGKEAMSAQGKLMGHVEFRNGVRREVWLWEDSSALQSLTIDQGYVIQGRFPGAPAKVPARLNVDREAYENLLQKAASYPGWTFACASKGKKKPPGELVGHVFFRDEEKTVREVWLSENPYKNCLAVGGTHLTSSRNPHWEGKNVSRTPEPISLDAKGFEKLVAASEVAENWDWVPVSQKDGAALKDQGKKEEKVEKPEETFIGTMYFASGGIRDVILSADPTASYAVFKTENPDTKAGFWKRDLATPEAIPEEDEVTPTPGDGPLFVDEGALKWIQNNQVNTLRPYTFVEDPKTSAEPSKPAEAQDSYQGLGFYNVQSLPEPPPPEILTVEDRLPVYHRDAWSSDPATQRKQIARAHRVRGHCGQGSWHEPLGEALEAAEAALDRHARLDDYKDDIEDEVLKLKLRLTWRRNRVEGDSST